MKTRMIYTLMLMLFATGALAQMYDDRPRITVGGEAIVKVKPDRILITFGIESWDNDIAASKEKNNEILKRTIEALKESGIGENEMQTDQLSIEPRWQHQYQKEDFLGYFVRNTFVVTVSDAEKVEDVVTRALESGVNYIHGVDFQTTELKKHREQARELALKAAKEKAEKMAAVLDQQVGPPILINEGHSPWWYHSSWTRWGGGRSGGMSQVMVQADRGESGDITDSIALGSLNIRANVTVTFELKN